MNKTSKILSGTETFTLLIWKEIPEFTKLFLIPNSVLHSTDGLLNILKIAHGKYGNSTLTNQMQADAIWSLYEILSTKSLYFDENTSTKYAGLLSDFMIDNGEITQDPPSPLEGKIITSIYKSGYFL
jgi:hypothetical protein